jgi:hypothetical protein
VLKSPITPTGRSHGAQPLGEGARCRTNHSRASHATCSNAPDSSKRRVPRGRRPNRSHNEAGPAPRGSAVGQRRAIKWHSRTLPPDSATCAVRARPSATASSSSLTRAGTHDIPIDDAHPALSDCSYPELRRKGNPSLRTTTTSRGPTGPVRPRRPPEVGSSPSPMTTAQQATGYPLRARRKPSRAPSADRSSAALGNVCALHDLQ